MNRINDGAHPRLKCDVAISFANNVYQAQERIVELHDNDVTCGRGKPAEDHAGNKWYLDRVKERRIAYNQAKSQLSKRLVAEEVVDLVRNRGGRFLKQDPGTKLWKDVGNDKAIAKTGKALREKPPAHGREGITGVERPPRQPVPVALDPVRRASIRSIEESMRQLTSISLLCFASVSIGMPCRHYLRITVYQVQEIIIELHPHDFINRNGGESNKSPSGIITYASRFSSPCTSILPSPVSAGSAKSHPGNVRLRELAEPCKHHYQNLKNAEKALFAKSILDQWRNETNPQGRFLRNVDGVWGKMAEETAVKVVMGVLRREPIPSTTQSLRPMTLAMSSGDKVPTHMPVSRASVVPPRPTRPHPSPAALTPVNLRTTEAPHTPMSAPPSNFGAAAIPAYISSSQQRPCARKHRRTTPPYPLAALTASSTVGGSEPTFEAAAVPRRSLPSFAGRVKSWVRRLACGRRGEELD
jgi:hypothetical protein